MEIDQKATLNGEGYVEVDIDIESSAVAKRTFSFVGGGAIAPASAATLISDSRKDMRPPFAGAHDLTLDDKFALIAVGKSVRNSLGAPRWARSPGENGQEKQDKAA